MAIDPASCRACSSTRLRGHPGALPPGWPARTRCAGCGSIAYAAPPDPALLEAYYRSSWEAGESGKDASGSTDPRIARQLLRAVGWTPGAGRHLDFGAGQGCLAREMAAGGAEVTAFEPYGGPELLRSGLRVVRSFSGFDPAERFDWILSMEVIEHLADPVDALKRLRALLAEDGRLVITTPNANGLTAWRQGAAWREAANPTHLTLFTMRGLRAAAAAAGFTRWSRVRRPMSYGKRGLGRYALAATQLLGIDGGLRVVLSA